MALHLLFVTIQPLAHYGWARMVAPFTRFTFDLHAWRAELLLLSHTVFSAYPIRSA